MNRHNFLLSCQLQETKVLEYVEGNYKYQSRKDMIYYTDHRLPKDIITELVILRKDGWLWISKYYAWDGCSGPTWDDSTNMRAGQAHDALYYLHRIGLLPLSTRHISDRILPRLMIEDRACKFRADYYEFAVNEFAASAADPKNQKKIIKAP